MVLIEPLKRKGEPAADTRAPATEQAQQPPAQSDIQRANEAAQRNKTAKLPIWVLRMMALLDTVTSIS